MRLDGWPRRSCISASFLIAISLVFAAAAATAQVSNAHATRQGQAIQQLEESLLRAMRGKDRAQLESLLSDEFDMVVAQEPDSPIDRDLWIASVMVASRRSWLLRQIMVRDWGELAIASFILRESSPGAAGARPPVFVVDVWRREDGSWHLVSRHAALALGSRDDIPGNAARRTAPKKY